MERVESQSCTDGFKAGLLQSHGPPAVCAHRQGAKDQKGGAETLYMIETMTGLIHILMLIFHSLMSAFISDSELQSGSTLAAPCHFQDQVHLKKKYVANSGSKQNYV